MRDVETGTDETPETPGTRMWVVSDAENDCSHSLRELRRLGSDGLNLYYECLRCGAALIAEDEVTLAASESIAERSPAATDGSGE